MIRELVTTAAITGAAIGGAPVAGQTRSVMTAMCRG
ncbi:Uncharacterised protein [Mycobacterium tuberculosis]|nr:Uncharacterised protein [Mycobacterium tuberculosis]